ncbi:transposase [Streptomyces sp. NBC_00377]|nr:MULTISPECIES: zinc ribbon domain-containing protein [unclassified Streptomyces]
MPPVAPGDLPRGTGDHRDREARRPKGILKETILSDALPDGRGRASARAWVRRGTSRGRTPGRRSAPPRTPAGRSLPASLRPRCGSQCGVKDGPKPPHVRVWTCGACGAVLDRDVNAAVDFAEAAGLAVSACGAQIREGVVPAPRGEAGTHSTPQPSTAP